MGQAVVRPASVSGRDAFHRWCESEAAKPYLRALAYRYLCPTEAPDQLAAGASLVLADPALLSMLRDWIDVTFDRDGTVDRR